MRPASTALFAVWLTGCTPAAPPEAQPPLTPTSPPLAEPAETVITIVGTNDVHGHIEHLPAFGGYVERLRELRRADGGVVLVDAGDMFQGTLESNLNEGAAVIAAFNSLGYTAAALGNHDFDYGPVGDLEPSSGADPAGALRARLTQARFPVLSANLVDTKTRRSPGWKNLSASTLVEVAGVKLGIVGVLTHETPSIVMPAYFVGLDVTPLAPAIGAEAKLLREQGARAVLAVAHAGGKCHSFDDARRESACAPDEELNRVLAQLPQNSVDAVIGGHTHQGVAHFLSGIAVAESFCYGRAFSRIDLHVPRDASQPVSAKLFPPREICIDVNAAECSPGSYEQRTIVPSATIEAVVSPFRETARKRRAERLGVEVIHAVLSEHGSESALGNLLSDLLLAATPGADIALLNGGGLRAPLPVGDLTYGQLYESQPFDNRVARLTLAVAALREVLRLHLERGRHGILSIAGARVEARCIGDRLEVALIRPNGKPLTDAERVTIVTSDYLASGGDELFAGAGRPAVPFATETLTVRDALAGELRRHNGSLDGEDPKLLDPKRPRLRLPSARPIRCGK
ncbi:MAG: bifunctional metallophosphatase/5'-nucleotidase [Myxococcales bacterium]|nr:bifunctional metallophosphatase/5'-nucleotidase [Myxococcales bacterium]